MTIIMNQSTSVLVTYESDNFIVENLETRKTVKIPTTEFLSGMFKYSNEFERRFKSIFPGKNELILTKTASLKIDDLIYFNRIDN